VGEQSGPTLIQSVQRALRLLEVVAERDGRAPAKELARATGLPLPTTYHLLRTLTHEGYLQRLDDGSYVLGHRIDVVRSHGTAARGVARARPALEWLRDELCSAVYLARHVDGEIVVVEIIDSPRAPRIDLWVGIHHAAHATALGKSILGQLAAADREDYLARHPLHKIVYGSEAPIFHPQWAIKAFMDFQIPQDLCDGYGYPQLTEQAKRKILGENLLRLHGLDVETTKQRLGRPQTH
jgi:hypothetical protein